MPRLSELYAKRLAARALEVKAKVRKIGQVLDRVQKRVLAVDYPPASRPGEARHRRSGRLQREAGVKVNEQTGTVQLVNTAPYARYLRDGTSRMGKRPWQDIVFAQARPEIERIERENMPFGGSE